MADEKTQLTLDLLARNKMGPATRESARDVEKVGSAADAAGKKTEKFTRTTTIAGNAQSELGEEASKTARRISNLDGEIDQVSRSIRAMTEELADADGAAARLDIGKGIRKAQADLKRLTSARGELSKDSSLIPLDAILPDVSPGAVAKWGDKLKGGLKGVAGAAAPILGGMALAAAPIIGGTIAAAIIGGAGIGGVIGGVVLAARSPEVAKAGLRLQETVLADMTSRAKTHFEKPVLAGIAAIQRGYAGLTPDIDRIFKASSRFTGPLVQGALGFVQKIVGGFADAAEAAGPVIDVLSNRLPDLGDAVADIFTSLKDNGVDAAVALDVALNLVEGSIRVVGGAVNGLVESFGFLARVGAFGRDAQLEYIRLAANAEIASAANREAANSLDGTKKAGEGVAGALGALVAKTTEAGKAADAHARSVQGQRGALLELSNALRAQTDPVFALREAQNSLKEAQDKASEAVRKHGRDSVEGRTATRNLASAALDLQGAVGALGGSFNGKLTPAMRNTYRAAGLTEAQINDVEREFRSAKRAGDAYAKTYRATVITNYINRYSNVVTSAADKAYAETKRGMQKRASGGPVTRGTPYLVGEHGPEVVVPNAAGRVLSAASSRGMARNGAAQGGGWPAGGVTARLELVGPEEVRVWFRKMVRTMNILPEV
jgi:hypothetical protein